MPTETAAEQVCLRLLARREHSRGELRRKLLLRGYPEPAIVEALDILAAAEWQDDARFLDSFLRQRLEKGYGPLRLRQELRERGVRASDADIAEFAAREFGGWAEALRLVYARKYDAETRLPRAEWARRCRYLQQRGFLSSQINGLRAELGIVPL